MSGSITINGYRIHSSPVVAEFLPALQLQPCGCSEQCRIEFNAWLMQRFGSRRQVLVIGGEMFVNPATMQYLKKTSNSEFLPFGGAK